MTNKRRARNEPRSLRQYAFSGILVALFAILMVRQTLQHGDDFRVFWNAAREVLAGGPLYSVERDGAMLFKYPPWILPAFFPLALLPLGAAKLLWGLIQSACLAYATLWLARRKLHPGVLAGTLLLFGGIWVVHGYAGQITLPLLAIGLWAGDRADRPGRIQLLLWAFSAKIFTLFPALGLPWNLRRLVRAAAIAIPLWAALSLPAVVATPGRTPEATFRAWREAASTGSVRGLQIHVKGREAQGLPSAVFRVLDIDERKTGWIALLAAAFGAALAMAWARLSRRLPEEDRWAGWLALMPVIQPLAWFNFFAMAFPLAALSLERAIASGSRRRLMAAAVGAFLVAAVTQKTMGLLGAWLEWLSVKSWGVLICAAALAWPRVRANR